MPRTRSSPSERPPQNKERHKRKFFVFSNTWRTFQATPFNLACFRVAVFAALLREGQLEWDPQFQHFMSPPYGFFWIQRLFPITIAPIPVLYTILRVSAWCGLLGLCCPLSTLLAGSLRLYLHGIESSFGHANHAAKHLAPFILLLSAAPCGDALSVDHFLRTAYRLRRRETLQLPRRSIMHARPLQYACVLLSLFYFFPGFWKVYSHGIGWMNELEGHLLCQRVFEPSQPPLMGLFLAVPILAKFSAATSVIMELALPFAVLSCPDLATFSLLVVLPISAFMQSVNLTMNIYFGALQITVLGLVDWPWILQRFGGLRQRLILPYSSNKLRTVIIPALLHCFDSDGRLSFTNTRAAPCPVGRQLRCLMWRVPFAGHASSSPPVQKQTATSVSVTKQASSSRRLHLLGVMFVCAYVVSGLQKQPIAYPFSCYPTFDHSPNPAEINVFHVEQDNSAALSLRTHQLYDKIPLCSIMRFPDHYRCEQLLQQAAHLGGEVWTNYIGPVACAAALVPTERCHLTHSIATVDISTNRILSQRRVAEYGKRR